MQSTLVKFVESGVERADAEQLVDLQQEAIARAAARDRAATRSTPPTPRTSCSTRLEALGVAGAVAARRAARRGRRRPRLARSRRRARRPGDGRRALHWVAATLTIGRVVRRAVRVDRPHRRRSSARSRATRTWTAASSSRSTCTRASRRRSPCSATSSSTRRSASSATTTATLPQMTVRGSELNQVWTNLLDNAIDALGEQGTITIRTRRDGELRRSSRSPTTAPASPRTCASGSSTRSSRRRTSARAPASACRPRGGSSSSATTALDVESEPGHDDVSREAAAHAP